MTRHMLAAMLLAAASAIFPAAVEAQYDGKPAAAAAAGQLADGEVRKVDKDAKKLTIRHGPLPQLDMPTPMTMVYQVKDPGLLERVRSGDKVKFSAEKVGGAYIVTGIEAVR